MGRRDTCLGGTAAEELSVLITSVLGRVTYQTEHRSGLVRLYTEKEQSTGLENASLESLRFQSLALSLLDRCISFLWLL